MRHSFFFASILVCLACGSSVAAEPRTSVENVRVVGSSSVAPFVLAIGKFLKDQAQIYVLETGTSAGFSALCKTIGEPIDVSGASRHIRSEELSMCAAHGISEIVELALGADGIVFAQSEKSSTMSLSSRDVFLAIARNIPRSDDDCVMVFNRSTQWNEVRDDLPAREILVLGPPTGSGTRDMLIEMVMRDGARSFRCLAALENRSPAFFDAAVQLRADGVWVDGGENDHAIAHTLLYLPHAIGIFGFSYLLETEGVVALEIDGILPTSRTIGDGSYRISRPLYLYATSETLQKRPVVIAMMKRITSPGAFTGTGILASLGLVMSDVTGRATLINTKAGTRTVIDGGIANLLVEPV